MLVNNAGIVAPGPLKKFDLGEWQKVIDVNLTGTFLGMRAAVQPMIDAGGGSIINVSSIEGLRGAPFVHPYVASKWAAWDWPSRRHSSWRPRTFASTRSPRFHPDTDDGTSARGHGRHSARPARRTQEVATFIVFPASDESSYSTGSEFIMDGGLVTAVPNKA